MSKPGFKIWDSVTLNEMEKLALQIRYNIENLAKTQQTHTDDLPASLVPTTTLYDLCSCFDAMYQMLLERDLVMTGNLRSNRNNIH